MQVRKSLATFAMNSLSGVSRAYLCVSPTGGQMDYPGPAVQSGLDGWREKRWTLRKST